MIVNPVVVDLDIGDTNEIPIEISSNQSFDLEIGSSIQIVAPQLQDKTKSFTPSEEAQSEIITADSEYDGLNEVTVNVDAIPNDYVGSRVPRRSSADMSSSGATVTAPNGYYYEDTSFTVPSGNEGTPTATKGNVSNHSVTITPSVTNTPGYINGGTHEGIGVSVSVDELVSGTKNIASNGQGIDVTEYAAVNVDVEPDLQTKTKNYTPTESVQSEEITYDSQFDGLNAVNVNIVAIPSDYVGSGIQRRSSSDLSKSGATVTAPAGYYENDASVSVQSGTEGTPVATKGTVSNHVITVTPSVTNAPGYIAGGTHRGTAVSVSANELVSGTKNISSNGQGIDVTEYAAVNVNVEPDLQTKTKSYTPTESAQSETFSADNGYDGLDEVIVNVSAIPSSYVGSGVARKTSSDLSKTGATVTAPAGYYENDASASVQSGTAGTPTATKGAVSNNSVSITPRVTNTTGYITGSTKTGTPITVSASELVSGSQNITSNGTYDVTNLAEAVVNVSGGAPALQTKSKTYTPSETSQSETVTADSGYDGLSSVDISVGAISSTYVGSGITRRSSSDLTASGATVIAPAGYYASSASKSISSGSATPAASISGSAATVSTGSNTLTLTKTVSNTPQVTAGYISSGTAGNTSVSLTASVTTKAAATITPGTSNQTIPAGTYLTGAQTIAGDSDLTADNIKAGVQIFNATGTYTSDATATAADIANGETAYVNGTKITGTLAFQTYYTGSSTPSSSLGNDGDIYLKT